MTVHVLELGSHSLKEPPIVLLSEIMATMIPAKFLTPASPAYASSCLAIGRLALYETDQVFYRHSDTTLELNKGNVKTATQLGIIKQMFRRTKGGNASSAALPPQFCQFLFARAIIR